MLATTIVVVVVVVALVRHFRVEENRRAAVRLDGAPRGDPLDGRPRPAASGPSSEFLWERVTPGGTFGLEFTSLMAILAVASFVLVAYTVIVSGEPGPTPGDTTAIEIVERLQTGWLTDFAKVFTHLGSAAVTGAARLRRARCCWSRAGAGPSSGCWSPALVLIFAGVHEIKDAVDRPRPGGGLVDASGSSFPSAHAAYSTFYVWLAVTIVMRLRPGMARGAAVIAAGIALTALVGLCRVYLGVHYLSDVSAGWALGVACFSLCAAVALVITTVRQNGRRVAAGAAEDRE